MVLTTLFFPFDADTVFLQPHTQKCISRPGVRSKRVKDCLEWGGECFADLLNETAPRIKRIAERTLGPSPWLTSFHALILYPEPDRSDDEVRRLRHGGLHTDFPDGEFKEKMDRMILGSMKDTTQGRPMGHGDRGWQFPEGWRPGDLGGPHTMQTIWILDEFTEKRGGTALYPGSFAFKRVPNCGPGDDFDEFEKHAVTQTGSAGDVRSVRVRECPLCITHSHRSNTDTCLYRSDLAHNCRESR